jgi:hypothetical protein
MHALLYLVEGITINHFGNTRVKGNNISNGMNNRVREEHIWGQIDFGRAGMHGTQVDKAG